MHVTTRRFHAREIERRTRIRALEGQARLLLNDLNEYHAWLEWHAGSPIEPADGRRALAARGLPADAGPDRGAPSAAAATSSRRTATSSSRSGTCRRRPAATSGSSSAIEAYIDLGAPAPETPTGDSEPAVALDLERIGDEDPLVP